MDTDLYNDVHDRIREIPSYLHTDTDPQTTDTDPHTNVHIGLWDLISILANSFRFISDPYFLGSHRSLRIYIRSLQNTC
jgi:hypothetical protein